MSCQCMYISHWPVSSVACGYIRLHMLVFHNCYALSYVYYITNHSHVCTRPCAGVMDNSGFEFTYLDTPRCFDAGVMSVGHQVLPTMVIPPQLENFDVFGVCDSSCTQVSKCACVSTHTEMHNITYILTLCIN